MRVFVSLNFITVLFDSVRVNVLLVHAVLGNSLVGLVDARREDVACSTARGFQHPGNEKRQELAHSI